MDNPSRTNLDNERRNGGNMADDEKAVERLVLMRLLHLNATILGLISGLVVGSVIFVATNFLVIKGGPVVGPHLLLLREFFIGYSVTFVGSLIGFAYGFASGFAIGYIVARIYNWLADMREWWRQKQS